jgi:heme o synthase
LEEGFRWSAIWSAPALFLFTVLFFWQLPHFVAINWMYRDQYEQGGFVMWSNGDENGDKTSKLALLFSLPLIPMMAIPYVSGHLAIWAVLLGVLLGGVMLRFALKFRKERTRESARSLFFFTLLYLPLLLGVVMFGWSGAKE